MGLKSKKKKAKKDQLLTSVSPNYSTNAEELFRINGLSSRSSICTSERSSKKSALVYPTFCVGKTDGATSATGKALRKEEIKNSQSCAIEDDVKTFASSTSVAWHTANDDDNDCSSYRSANSSMNNGALSSVYHEVNTKRSLKDVMLSFADEKVTDDQRACDLSAINDLIENNPSYMKRCSLRSTLTSLNLLRGVNVISKTEHPALNREIQRLVESEAKDIIIQEVPQDSPDQRCAMDLLFDWFTASDDPQEYARKHHLLRILAHNRNLTEPVWARLLPSISKVLDVKIGGLNHRKFIAEESNAKETSMTDVPRNNNETRMSSCNFHGNHCNCTSTSPTPPDPDNEEKLDTSLMNVKKNSLKTDDLFLRTVAPMPKIKNRPRSKSRHRATSLALIPPNERNPEGKSSSPTVSTGYDLTVQQEQTTLSKKIPPSPIPSVPILPTRTTKGQSFSMSFILTTSPTKSRQTGDSSFNTLKSATKYVDEESASRPIQYAPSSPSVSRVPTPPITPPPPTLPSISPPQPTLPTALFSKSQANCLPCSFTSPPPPPPPSPPPPPPPPPPPLPLGILGQPALSPLSSISPHCAARSDEVYPKKKKTYTLLWQAISQHDITNVHTVWNEYSRPEFSADERDHVQLLFERIETTMSRFSSERRSVRGSSMSDNIFQLPQQKALNLEIILAKLRPLTVLDLVIQLESNNMDGISVDLLSSLLKYFPTEEEVLIFKKVNREDVKRNCDILCWEAARRSTLRIRTELVIAREQILQDLARHSDSAQRIRSACEALRSPIFVLLLHKCLQYGNFINQGTALSRAVGFSLSSLPSVLSAKGKRENALNLRLVDLLAQYVEFDISTLENLISSLQYAKSITLVDVETASKELSSSISRLQHQLVTKASGDTSLLKAYQPFLETAEARSLKLASELQDLHSLETSLQLFLCATSMKLEEIVSITYESLTMLLVSIKNRTRVKLGSLSNRQLAGRETLSLRRRSFQQAKPSVDVVRQMFLEAVNQ